MSRWYREYYYPRPQPRLPANGIRLRAQSGKIGKTWWAGQWIAALERLVDSARLSRGRSYARSGQVIQLDVGRDGVAARVQGSRPTPYKVSITFRRLSDADWERVIGAMAQQSIYAARLLSGEMPEEIETVFTAAGTALFPATQGDLSTSCSCPDWANPCKHVAAVHYLLGERFDDDPFLIFELRGRTKEEIVTALRARRTTAIVEEVPQEEVAAAIEGEVPAPPLDAALGTFWLAPPLLADLKTSFTAPAVAALPVKRLGPAPFAPDPAALTAQMEDAYQAVSAHALRLAMGDETTG